VSHRGHVPPCSISCRLFSAARGAGRGAPRPRKEKASSVLGLLALCCGGGGFRGLGQLAAPASSFQRLQPPRSQSRSQSPTSSKIRSGLRRARGGGGAKKCRSKSVLYMSTAAALSWAFTLRPSFGCHLYESPGSVAAARRLSWLGCSPTTNMNLADHVRIMWRSGSGHVIQTTITRGGAVTHSRHVIHASAESGQGGLGCRVPGSCVPVSPAKAPAG
jgi:hypothetical protein